MLRTLLVAATLTAVGVPVVIANADPTHGARSHHRRHAAQQVLAPVLVPAPPVPLFRGPGYHFVPGVGIIDEACNLPTSACPNEYRDVNG